MSDPLDPGDRSEVGCDVSGRVPIGSADRLPWIGVAPGAPYFVTDGGRPWHPIGQNDAVTWVELAPLYRRANVAAVERYLSGLRASGVTCMRLMLEYAQGRHRYFERSPGVFSKPMIRYWDDLFCLCQAFGIRILLTPFDTFWTWLRFQHHPYSVSRGGLLDHPSQFLLSKAARAAIKNRLTFAAERWGGSGVIFAWDVWNEIHPAHAGMSAEPFDEFITDLSEHLESVERRAHGRSHLKTVSLFGPELQWRPALRMERDVFRHPSLDFATIHIYEEGTIDDPRNTVDAAVGMGRIVRASIAEIEDGRPFLDTEHGPIHRFKDRRQNLPEPFDDEYFRHMQWAHLASGGAGGGMRWPNRHPHVLTPGMRQAQAGLSGFMPLIDWLRFDRRNVSGEIGLTDEAGGVVGPERVARFCSASRDQAIVYLLRRDTIAGDGRLDAGADALSLRVTLAGLDPGRYVVAAWDTLNGSEVATFSAMVGGETAMSVPPVSADLVLALRLEPG